MAVWHPDGYIELRDRAKDVIISGGENISTIEVEQAIASHPAVLEAAVVAMPHDHWGERPKAVVVVKPGTSVTTEELIAHVKGRIARFKAPDVIDFVDALPKTSTGKIQKYVLREKEWAGQPVPHSLTRTARHGTFGTTGPGAAVDAWARWGHEGSGRDPLRPPGGRARNGRPPAGTGGGRTAGAGPRHALSTGPTAASEPLTRGSSVASPA